MFDDYDLMITFGKRASSSQQKPRLSLIATGIIVIIIHYLFYVGKKETKEKLIRLINSNKTI